MKGAFDPHVLEQSSRCCRKPRKRPALPPRLRADVQGIDCSAQGRQATAVCIAWCEGVEVDIFSPLKFSVKYSL